MAKKSKKRRKRRAKVYALRTAFVILCITVIMIIGFGGYKLVSSLLPKQSMEADQDTIAVSPKGIITGSILEAFDQEYYNSDELKSMIDQETTEYSGLAGTENAVKLKDFKIKNQQAEVVMEYETADDYRSFNGKELYTGTVEDLMNKGIITDGTFQSAADGQPGLAAGELLQTAGKRKAVVMEEAVAVKVPGKILYCNDRVKVTGNKTAEVNENSDNLAIIIYK